MVQGSNFHIMLNEISFTSMWTDNCENHAWEGLLLAVAKPVAPTSSRFARGNILLG